MSGFEWSDHAVKRLGERFGTRSPKVRNLIETMLAMNEYDSQPDPQGDVNVIHATLRIRENPVTLVISHHRKRDKLIVVTVRPQSKTKRRIKKSRKWFQS